MSAELDIPTALELRAKEILTPILGAEIAYPNIPFTPKEGTPYARVNNVPAKTRAASVGTDALTRRPGFFQVSLFFPQGEGLKRVLEAATALKNGMKRGSVLSRNTTHVTIQNVSVGPELPEPGWVMVPVTVDWLAHTED